MLSSVLLRAGGISKNGFLWGAALIKVEAKKREREQLERLDKLLFGEACLPNREQENKKNLLILRMPRLNLRILQSVLEEEAFRRVVIDLPAILSGDPDADIQLEAGDKLFVPEFNNTVSVIGEVRKPGNFRYEGRP